MKKFLWLVGFIGAANFCFGAESIVYVRGAIEPVAARFAGQKPPHSFVQPAPGEEFKNPTPIKFSHLEVPASIRADRNEHRVDVGMIVSANGDVIAVAVAASNSKPLENAAREMARGFRFSPATLARKPVWCYVELPVTYKYVDPEEALKKLRK